MKRYEWLITSVRACIIIALVIVLMVTLHVLPFGATNTTESVTRVGFSSDDESQYTYVDISEIEGYSPIYDKFNDRVYYSSLNESEQFMYSVYEYAFEHAYPYIHVYGDFLDDMTVSTKTVMRYFSFDHALIEGNLRTVFQTNEYGTRMIIYNFDEEHLQKKLIALEVAEDICADLDDSITDKTEIAKYFYDLLRETVTYKKDSKTQNYLYDALCMRETNCDGYTQAYSLFCALNDIECFEKLSIEEDHVWNCIKLDGKWYNVDATNAANDFLPEGKTEKIRTRFAFSDAFHEMKYKYSDILPTCTSDLYEPTVWCYAGTEESSADVLAQVMNNSEEGCFLVRMDADADMEYFTDLVDRKCVLEKCIKRYSLTYDDGSSLYYRLYYIY